MVTNLGKLEEFKKYYMIIILVPLCSLLLKWHCLFFLFYSQGNFFPVLMPKVIRVESCVLRKD